MICALCDRPISRADVAADRYTYSRWTGNNYCIRKDCRAVYSKLKAKADLRPPPLR